MYNTRVLLRSKLNLGFNLNYFSFCCKFCAFRSILFYILELLFFTFYLRINKPNIHNNIIGISSFQNGLNDRFSSTGFLFKSKVI